MLSDTDRRNLFIDATAKLVAETGLENLRTKQIATEVGKSEGMLFALFGSKESLLSETFEEIDRRMSDNLLRNRYIHNEIPEDGFGYAAYEIWRKVYRYLLEHREETMFFIRFRHSSYYTLEMHRHRQAYNGAFERLYDMFAAQYAGADRYYRGFLVDFAFDLTLNCAEKILVGQIRAEKDTEQNMWKAVSQACLCMLAA